MGLSLRELLLLVAAVAVAVPSLLYGGPLVSGATVCAVGVVLVAMGIHVVIDRGEAQAGAIGFAIPAAIYAVLVVSSVNNSGRVREWLELDPYTGSMPTTRMLRPVMEWAWSRRSYYIDPQGNRTQQPPPPGASLMGGLRPNQPGFGGGWRSIELPHRADFMATAHALWTLLFGYLGSKYGRRLYTRRRLSRASSSAVSGQEIELEGT